jgi:hypothetical protein
MDTPTFNKLTFGNIIQESGGETYIVQHTLKDASGNTVAIGVMPAFLTVDAAGLTLVNNSYSQTLIVGSQTGQLQLMGVTVQGSIPAGGPKKK